MKQLAKKFRDKIIPEFLKWSKRFKNLDPDKLNQTNVGVLFQNCEFFFEMNKYSLQWFTSKMLYEICPESGEHRRV